MHSTSKSSIAHHHPSPVPMSSQLIRQIPRVSQCPIDRIRRQRSNHLPASATYYRETDASFNFLLARHGPHMHAACMHGGAAAPSQRSSAVHAGAYRQYVSFRHSTFRSAT